MLSLLKKQCFSLKNKTFLSDPKLLNGSVYIYIFIYIMNSASKARYTALQIHLQFELCRQKTCLVIPNYTMLLQGHIILKGYEGHMPY